MQDVTQIELIILGKEKELTFADDGCEIVTVTKPLERIILHYTAPDAFRILGAADRVVGISSYMVRYQRYLPVISKKPSIGSSVEPDIEMIIELEPDIIFTGANPRADVLAKKLKGTNIIVARLFPRNEEWVFKNYWTHGLEVRWPGARDNVLKLGYILGEVEKAEEYAEWYDNIVDPIEERVSEIPEDEWPKVFLDWGSKKTAFTRAASGHTSGWKKAGGTLVGPISGNVEIEWLIEQNPDVIVGSCCPKCGYESDDESGFKAAYDDILGVPGFNHVKAVQDGRVHILVRSAVISQQLGIPICTAYQAKWYHPELFEDMDPQEIHQEFIDRFCPGLDFDVREDGVFVYPPLEERWWE